MYWLTTPEIPFHPPWDRGFPERLALLCGEGTRVAYFHMEPDPSSFRYRVYNMVEAINAGPGASASWFHLGDADRFADVIREADVLVLARVLYGPQVMRLIQLARNKGIRILFDVDDLVFDPDFAHLLMDATDIELTNPAMDHVFGTAARHEVVLKMCDGALTTNSYLAERIRERVDLPVQVVPNFMNKLQCRVSDRLWEDKASRNFCQRDGRIHIGYFSGTATHNRDFRLAAGALREVMEADPRVHLRLTGPLESGGVLEPVWDRVEFMPLQDYLNLQRRIAQMEINIAPLQDNVFTHCKSELKYFEAAAVGTLTVASPTFAFGNAIRHGETGWLSPAQAWGDRLREAIAVLDADPRRILYAARADAAGRYGWHVHRDRILAAVVESHGG